LRPLAPKDLLRAGGEPGFHMDEGAVGLGSHLVNSWFVGFVTVLLSDGMDPFHDPASSGSVQDVVVPGQTHPNIEQKIPDDTKVSHDPPKV